MIIYNSELYHYGVPRRSGRYKWGSGKNPYHHGTSMSPRAIIARHNNRKVDKSFKKWKEGSATRDAAISAGKIRNEKRMAFEQNRNRETKAEYKQAEKAYKKALGKNTMYRKGTVRQDVGRDLSRKMLQRSKQLDKQLQQNPNDRQLRKDYKRANKIYSIERDKARKAQSVGASRSNKKAAIKRGMKMSAKAAIAAGATAGAAYQLNKRTNINGQEFMNRVARGYEFYRKAKRFTY